MICCVTGSAMGLRGQDRTKDAALRTEQERERRCERPENDPESVDDGFDRDRYGPADQYDETHEHEDDASPDVELSVHGDEKVPDPNPERIALRPIRQCRNRVRR